MITLSNSHIILFINNESLSGSGVEPIKTHSELQNLEKKAATTGTVANIADLPFTGNELRAKEREKSDTRKENEAEQV
jgi:hypothetical protein